MKWNPLYLLNELSDDKTFYDPTLPLPQRLQSIFEGLVVVLVSLPGLLLGVIVGIPYLGLRWLWERVRGVFSMAAGRCPPGGAMDCNDGTQSLDPQHPSADSAPTGLSSPIRIGPYKILKVLGEGGMGQVYLAEQLEPVRRLVALKLIKLGMDTRQVIARFESERQALAMLSHPNVAQVFDAGSTDQGRPYFVMELVPGIPITEYCDRHRLSTRARLELFSRVCHAIHHAHQKGVIHRDIKPSNVLVHAVDGKPVPKVIDFGIAKAANKPFTEQAVFTQEGVLVGTPEYMSPEQAGASAGDVDTRTDVYSLGVLLYELLVGARPFDSSRLRHAALDELLRVIRDEEPLKPSARVSGLGVTANYLAANRSTEPRTLVRHLRGDLDWITMRALDKNRSRRYGSAWEFAGDVDRYLADEPVTAGPPSAGYRARKFVRRHRVGVTIGLLTFLIPLGVAAATILQAARVASERDRADLERETAERVSQFLEDVLGNVDAKQLGDAALEDLTTWMVETRRGQGLSDSERDAVLASMQEVLSGFNATDMGLRMLDAQILGPATQRIQEKLKDDPALAGRLERTAASVYLRWGMYQQAAEHAARAVEILEQTLGPEHRDTLSSGSLMAVAYDGEARYAEAEAIQKNVLSIQRRTLGESHPDVLASMNALAKIYSHQGRGEDAAELYLGILRTSESQLSDKDVATQVRKVLSGFSFDALAAKAVRDGEGDSFVERQTTLVDELRKHGLTDLDALEWDRRRAWIEINEEHYTEAKPLLLDTLKAHEHELGSQHPYTLGVVAKLAQVYIVLGKYPEAESLLRANLAACRRVLGEDHPMTIDEMSNLALSEELQGRLVEPGVLLQQLLDSHVRTLGDDAPQVINWRQRLAAVRAGEDRLEDAAELYETALDSERRLLGPDDPDTLDMLNQLAIVYFRQGRYSDAKSLFSESLRIERRLQGEDDPQTLQTKYNLALALESEGNLAEAEAIYRETLEARRRVLGEKTPLTVIPMLRLASIAAARGNASGAMGWLRQAVEAGCGDSEWLRTNAALAGLHGPEFDALIERADRNAAAGRSKRGAAF